MLSPANALADQRSASDIDHPAQDGFARRRGRVSGERKPQALVFGPGLGPHDKVGRFALDLLAAVRRRAATMVIDADGLTSLAQQPRRLFEAARRPGAPSFVLTPHDGEFARLFPTLPTTKRCPSSTRRARRAARDQHDRRLQRAGHGDRIARRPRRHQLQRHRSARHRRLGRRAGRHYRALAAQGMPAFEAACAAVWMHAEAAERFGPGLIAEDLPLRLLPVLRELHEMAAREGPIMRLPCGRSLGHHRC